MIPPTDIMPLEEFPAAKREEIERLVALDTPPPKWKRFIGAQIPSRAWHEWHWRRGIDPLAKRTPISKAVRRQVIERDGYECRLCGDSVEPDDVHLDHIQPRSLGGSDMPHNLQVTHSRCNMRKGNRV